MGGGKSQGISRWLSLTKGIYSQNRSSIFKRDVACVDLVQESWFLFLFLVQNWLVTGVTNPCRDPVNLDCSQRCQDCQDDV